MWTGCGCLSSGGLMTLTVLCKAVWNLLLWLSVRVDF
ncbi:hypothetical protein Acr_00g0099030 [Actinidia rufa]|uniref:Uncharacterized protein n=1 Tax=Actinidia rufa TaxID=165716 RepID=A0A7J0DZN3_9ERIC|nr:hypothetical protein Acr_00g0099030 [Actinidia rufa]